MRKFVVILSFISHFWVTPLIAVELPKDLVWETGKPFPEFAAKKVEKGGTVNDALLTFPLTFRTVGPDSNGSFRSLIGNNDMSLLTIHPNTEQIIPQLATHWAYGKNKRTMYFKINPLAKWSDGKPVTGEDFVYTREFHLSKHLVAPWYNEYYQNQIESIQKTKDSKGAEVVIVTLPEARPDLWYYCNIRPIPKHFFHPLDKDFVKKYNWKIAPNTGPYKISKFKKGKFVEFKRKKDWWAKDQAFFKNRFNIDKVRYKVIRDLNIAFEHLKKGKLDMMSIVWPDFWHDKTKAKPFDQGYIHRLMAYNDKPRSDYFLTLNMDHPVLANKDVRLAMQHSMNVDKVIKQVLRNDYQRLNGPSRGMGKYTNQNIVARPFDLDLADKHLKKAGWAKRGADGIRIKEGKKLSFTINYGQGNMTQRLVVLKEDAKKAGIELNLKQMDPAANFKSLLEKQHEIAYMSWSTSFRPSYWGRFHSANAHKPQTNNFANIANKSLDKHIDTFRNSPDEKIRMAEAQKIQQIIHDEAAHIPLFEVPYYRIAYWGWMQFPETPGTKSSESVDYFSADSGGLYWIDPTMKKKILNAKKANKKLAPVVIVDDTFRVTATSNQTKVR